MIHSVKKLKELLGVESIKWSDSFKYGNKVVLIQGEVSSTKLRKLIDFCNNNSLFYGLDTNSNLYIY